MERKQQHKKKKKISSKKKFMLEETKPRVASVCGTWSPSWEAQGCAENEQQHLIISASCLAFFRGRVRSPRAWCLIETEAPDGSDRAVNAHTVWCSERAFFGKNFFFSLSGWIDVCAVHGSRFYDISSLSLLVVFFHVFSPKKLFAAKLLAILNLCGFIAVSSIRARADDPSSTVFKFFFFIFRNNSDSNKRLNGKSACVVDNRFGVSRKKSSRQEKRDIFKSKTGCWIGARTVSFPFSIGAGRKKRKKLLSLSGENVERDASAGLRIGLCVNLFRKTSTVDIHSPVSEAWERVSLWVTISARKQKLPKRKKCSRCFSSPPRTALDGCGALK